MQCYLVLACQLIKHLLVRFADQKTIGSETYSSFQKCYRGARFRESGAGVVKWQDCSRPSQYGHMCLARMTALKPSFGYFPIASLSLGVAVRYSREGGDDSLALL